VTELDMKRIYCAKAMYKKLEGKFWKKIFFAIFLDLINLFWTEETTMKEGSKDARFICLAASVRELGLLEFFSKGKVVKEVFAYGRNFDKHQKEGF
jgi:hypothetical protein